MSAEKSALLRETHEYLRGSVNRSYYLEFPNHEGVMKELTERVLNARSWTFELPSFEAVQEVVVSAVKSFPEEK